MLSIKQCQAYLSANGKNYSDEEVKKIREFLYTLGEIEYGMFKKINKNENSGDLHACFDRRPGHERQ